ncbi:hypothetical protein EV356DRAFT_456609 [Viridothelium virens]|uniref:Inactive metallocarboxypeptidase ECM14 n=1 Tax=Viridothelium virens TaxID=1048519 RepID=A0A6A6GU33_VIRVR|nr:hypothetical protein EV356DRAFT_456609 [Viridothelium virens]
MAIRSAVATSLTLRLLFIALLSICLASLVSGATSQSYRRLEPKSGIAKVSEEHYPHHQLSSWRRLSNRIIQKVLGYPESVKSLASSSVSRGGDGQPTHRLRTRYSEDIVLRFNCSTADEAWALSEACEILFLDVWEFGESFVDVRLSKDTVSPLLSLLPESLQDAHAPIMQDLDLAQAVYNSYPQTFSSSTRPHDNQLSNPNTASSNTEDANIFFQNYQPLSVILPWMRLMASIFPTHVRMINVGKTFENREIPALKVGVHPTNSEKPLPPRKTIIVTGGIHAREWISTSSVNYLAYSLATQYGKSQLITSLIESFDWIFVPSVNPDGYVYTWNDDRLWRKSRQPTSLRFCSGIDLDRSFGYHWDGAVTSDNPCSESFAGEEPFGAIETGTFVDWVRNQTTNHNAEVVAFLDLHSYSQEVLYPYSYSCTASPPSLENLQELAMGLAKAMRLSSGHYYKVVSACEGNVMPISEKAPRKSSLPQGGGSALDWFYGEMGVRYAFQIKLRDTGSYGFLLPKEHIVPTGKEVLEAALHLARHMRGDFDYLKIPERGPSMISTNWRKPSRGESSRFSEENIGGLDGPQTGEILDQDDQWELRRRKRR